MNGTAEIKGIPREVIDVFSKRREEIESAVAEAGHTSPNAYQVATLATRRPKGHEAEPPVALARWWEEARALGFSDVDLAACLSRAVEGSVESERSLFMEGLDETFADLMSETGLTMMMSSFAERDVIQAMAERAVHSCSAEELCEFSSRFVESARPIRLNTAGKDSDAVLSTEDETVREPSLTRYSTPELLRKEARILQWSASAFDGTGAVAPIATVEKALQRHKELTEEQMAMVRALTRNGDRLHIIVGDPGSGKTYAMKVAVEAFAASDVPVIGAAVSAEASSELESSVQLSDYTGRRAGTGAKLLSDLDHPEHGGFAYGTVLILDEASMVGTRMLHGLLEHLEKANGTLVLLGDPNQHGSVETGGAYRHLTELHSSRVVRLRANNRQIDEVERQAIVEFREGRISHALGLYGGAGKIVQSKTIAESFEKMAEDWFSDWCRGERSPMIAGLNTTRRELNDRARSLLLRDGLLGDDSLTVGEREFRAGDWIVARKNSRYLEGANNKSVTNGSVGTVVALNAEARSITVNFENEGIIRLPDWYVDNGHVDHAYARTTYGVQGKTLGLGNYQPTDASSFEEAYVALTRAKSGTRIYIVDGNNAEVTRPHCIENNDRLELDSELIAKALEKRRAKAMAHEISSDIDLYPGR